MNTAAISSAFQEFEKGNLNAAAEKCSSILQDGTVELAETLYLNSAIAIRLGQFPSALESLSKAISLIPEEGKYYGLRGMVYMAQKKYDEASQDYRSAHRHDPENDHTLQLGREIKNSFIPGILVNTVPKSGSMFIWYNLSKGLEIDRFRIGDSHFPYGFADIDKSREMVQGNKTAHHHFLPIKRNLLVLKEAGIDKLIVHVRDPRQVLESLVFHFDKVINEYETKHINRVQCKDFPDDYHELPASEKIDILIEAFFTELVDFVTGWVGVSEEPEKWGLKVLLTRFQDMKAEPQRFFDRILEFYGIEPGRWVPQDFTPKQGQKHFRRGEIDSWRETLSSEQGERVTKMMPDWLFDRFGWRK